MLDLSHEFDLGERVYLDGANHGPLPRRAYDAALTALSWKRDPSLLDDGLYFALPDRVRAGAAQLLGCNAADVAIATGASHGISLVACGLDWQRGDRVLIPRGEFPANSLPWLSLRAQGVEVDIVDPDRIVESIRDRTRVVSVGHVNFANGRRIDLAPIGAACADRDVLFLVDAAQSLGALPFDVARYQPAVVAVAGYKWLMSPYGTGFTYVNPAIVDRLRLPTFNWASIEGSDNFNRLLELEPRHRPGAARFDVPEAAAFIQLGAMAESLELLLGTGIDRVWAHARELIDRLISGLPDGFGVTSSMEPARRSSIVRLVAEDDEATVRVHRCLRDSGVAVSLRESGLRVAPGLWNRASDIDRLLAELERAR